jgi:hypothetical protein
MAVQTQIQARRGTAATWTSTNPTLAAGEMGFETDTGKFKIGTGSASWTALGYAGGGQNTLSTYVYTATSGQTSFSGADSNGNTLSYTVGAIQVYLNGALLTPTSDFTASTGTSVVLVSGAITSDTLTVLALGSFTVSTDIAKSTLSTKGDILTATAASTPAVLAVGADGSSIVADSSTSTGLRYQANYAAGKNLLINGAFDIWQRGTSFASGGYMTDRWTDDSTLSNMTASQQTSGAPNGSRYILRYTATGASAYKNITQYIETAQAQQAWGNTVTFSIKMRRNATATGGNLGWSIQKSATVDAGSGATWTSLGNSNTVLSSLTTGTGSTDWTTVTISAAIPNDGTANSLRLNAGFGAAQASGAIVEFAQAQLEIGSVATAFSRAGGSIQGELAACQRYYQIVHSFTGNASLSTQIHAPLNFVMPMRTSPSVAGSAALYVSDGTNDFQQSSTNVAFVNGNRVTSQNCQLVMTNFTGMTQWRSYMQVSTAGGDIQLSAEL